MRFADVTPPASLPSDHPSAWPFLVAAMVIVFCLCALWVWSWWRARKETTAALIDALVHGPGYGLDLIERVNKQTQGRLVLGQGSVYPHLRELEREGLLESYEGEPLPQRGGRPRRYYKLTAKGVAAVRP